MIGIVVVSHSARLAEGVVDLAREMAGPDVPIAAAGGLDEPPDALGTDALRVLGALEQVAPTADGGTLVLMDLGSAVLSAETALDLLEEDRRARVLLCAAPLAEGAVAAAAAAGSGATLAEAAAEARRGLAGKERHLGAPAPEPGADPAADGREGEWLSVTAAVGAPHGLHARPAAAIVRAASAIDAEVRLENVTAGRGPAGARSMTSLSTLGALRGHTVRILARGPDAQAALETLRALVSEEDRSGAPGDRTGASQAATSAPGGTEVAAPAAGQELRGAPASPGSAAGPARALRQAPVRQPDGPTGTPEEELAALRAALDAVAADLAAAQAAAAARVGAEAAEIVEAQVLLLHDEALVDSAARGIAAGCAAADAWEDAVRSVARRYEALDDDYLRARAADLLDVERRVRDRLADGMPMVPAEPERPGILVADELGAAEAAALDATTVLGIATAGGGPTSHASIIARALGLPAVAGLGPAVLRILEGTTLLLDGDDGTVIVDPAPEVAERHAARRREAERRAAEALAVAHEPAVTLDGRRVEVAANVGAPGDVEEAVANGADGVGLLRTEFLFLARRDAPDEDEQQRAYSEAAAALAGRRMVLRTLDAGADKPLPYLALPHEDNPFLGVRGIRLSLERPELLVTQLRAALRVAAAGPLAVMFPMVSEVGELRTARGLLERARTDLAAEGSLAGEVEVGAMVEVPSAALGAGALAAEADFLSIGTNDLVQYAMAAERGNARVGRLSDPVHPAVLRLIAGVVEAAAPHGCRVAVCGEAASDPQAVPLLVGLGVDELSVAPRRIPLVKAQVRAIDGADARELVARALDMEDAASVREMARREAPAS